MTLLKVHVCLVIRIVLGLRLSKSVTHVLTRIPYAKLPRAYVSQRRSAMHIPSLQIFGIILCFFRLVNTFNFTQ